MSLLLTRPRPLFFLCLYSFLGALLCGCAEPKQQSEIAQQNTQQDLSQSGALITQSYVLSNTTHVSDGTGDMFNGKRRFFGALGAQAISHNGYQYVIYYEGKDRRLDRQKQFANIVVARRKLGTTDWQRSVLQGYQVKSEDAHNRSTIGISAQDGTIHIAFDHHNQAQLNYARTAVGVATHPDEYTWDDSIFTFTPNLGLEDDIDIVTYPYLKSVPGGTVILYYRDGLSYGGDMRLAYYNAQENKWEWIRELSSRYGSYLGVADERGPYLSGGIQVSQDQSLKMSWVWRETSLGCAHRRERVDEKMCNQGIYFAQSKDFGLTWQNAFGQKIADLSAEQAISIDTIGGPLIPVPHQARPSNVLNSAVIDPKTGNFHIFNSHLRAPYDDLNQREVYHYQIKADGSYTSKVVEFNARSVKLAFIGEDLYAFSLRDHATIFVAKRASDFSKFEKIPFKISKNLNNKHGLDAIEGGYINWDLSNKEAKVVSILWDHKTQDKMLGLASPLQVIDVKLPD